MPNFVNFVVTNAINSKEQYRCTPAGVSNLLKISTVVDQSAGFDFDEFQTYLKFLLL